MFEISTSDVLAITQNNALEIKKALRNSNNYIEDIKKDTSLQEKIEQKLKILITKNIKYSYLLYKDKKGTFRFLVDASEPKEKAFLNQKFDVDSKDWFDIYEQKKPLIIKHKFLQELSISYIVPILYKDNVELILAIDFSLKKVENINHIIDLMQNGIIIIFTIIILFIIILIIQTLKYTKVKKTAFIDKLTNVYNRNYLQEHQESINLDDYVLAIVDIDHFKKVNDTYGHNVGDIILKEVAKIMKNTIRVPNDDLIIRFGGEEFILLIKISKETKDDSLIILNRILKNIEKNMFTISSTKYINITISIGVNLNPNESKDFKEAFNLADKALYNAKNSGRNNIKTKVNSD